MSKLNFLKSVTLGGVSAFVLAGAAFADDFNIPGGDLSFALSRFSTQTGVPLIVSADAIKGVHTRGAAGDLAADVALSRILAGTGFVAERHSSGAIAVVHEQRVKPTSSAQPLINLAQAAANPVHASGIESVLVTAQKRTEDIQMVPIAVTALSSQQLNAMKIEGGPDLLKTIPNVTFSKNNFTGYNFSIRGIGTKAISATTDPGVAVAFNSTTLIQNRLFEQEYFDVERVEVLRGPQGTLYGRNATSGVINVISAKPDLGEFFGSIKGEVGNYQSRRGVGMLNIPIIQDKLGIRLAGSYTKRDGYDFNTVTNHPVNGRDLWSARATVGFHPIEQLHGNLIWEHFNENDDRSRTGKQLCHHDSGPDAIGTTPLTPDNPKAVLFQHALFSQGCKPGSLYDADAFGTPNGLALNFVFGMQLLSSNTSVGFDPNFPNGVSYTPLLPVDPYGGRMQSPDLRSIASFRDPRYTANADLEELNFDVDLTDNLTLSSQSAYDKDKVYSFQDFNRFNTDDIFTDTSNLLNTNPMQPDVGPSDFVHLLPGGVYCDPQLGCSKTMAGFDISKASATQYSQELRLQSDFAGPLNFSVGANYTSFKTLVDYYVMFNVISLLSQVGPFNRPFDRQIDLAVCGKNLLGVDSPTPIPAGSSEAGCPYIDPNPVESINGEGHNYFRSKNPYALKSWAAFGEVYYQIDPDVKLTAGLRYTNDKKSFIPVPSQVLLAPGLLAGGTVSKGYPELPAIDQRWREFTGRLNVSWMPKLDFTDQTMIYASYSRGYKGGGANPPSPGFATADQTAQQLTDAGYGDLVDLYKAFGLLPILTLTAKEYGPTFKPEFVNAFEVGTKNTLFDGTMTLNTTAFFYDYKDYQVSQIRDRTAVNENFDAKTWGAELESVFAASHDFQIIANLGYLDSRIADGATSIDIMNRTQGNPNYLVAKPWPQLPSNCVVPVHIAQEWYNNYNHGQNSQQGAEITGAFLLCGGLRGLVGAISPPLIDPLTGAKYDPNTYPEINGGAGLKANLGGNQLPNAPHFTFNIGAAYTLHWIKEWDTRVRGDFYHQSASFARVYNDRPYDRLRGWNNVNLSLTFERVEDALSIELYVKNVFNTDAITDAFLNSDDTALTTNVFTTDPRLIGFSITKPF